MLSGSTAIENLPEEEPVLIDTTRYDRQVVLPIPYRPAGPAELTSLQPPLQS
jgi:hypothetical protein